MLTTILRGGKQAGWQFLAEMLQIKAGLKEDRKGQILILVSPDMSMMVKFAPQLCLIIGDVTGELHHQVTAGLPVVSTHKATWKE